ncbi:hypothetical protein CLAIMM_10849 isoform 2, partial [Cladophialophora immunda]
RRPPSHCSLWHSNDDGLHQYLWARYALHLSESPSEIKRRKDEEMTSLVVEPPTRATDAAQAKKTENNLPLHQFSHGKTLRERQSVSVSLIRSSTVSLLLVNKPQDPPPVRPDDSAAMLLWLTDHKPPKSSTRLS